MSTTLRAYFGRNVLSPTLLVQHHSWQKVFLSFCSTMNKILRTIPPAGIRTPFSAEYNGKTACVNNNLDFVRKAEQTQEGKARLPGQLHLGTASSVDAPSFRVITQLLHDFVQPVADSGRLCRAPNRGSMAANRHLSFIDSSFNLFPLIIFRARNHKPGASNRDRSIGGQDARFRAKKKSFKSGPAVDVRCTHRLTLHLGIDPKFANCHLSRPARSGR